MPVVESPRHSLHPEVEEEVEVVMGVEEVEVGTGEVEEEAGMVEVVVVGTVGEEEEVVPAADPTEKMAMMKTTAMAACLQRTLSVKQRHEKGSIGLVLLRRRQKSSSRLTTKSSSISLTMIIEKNE